MPPLPLVCRPLLALALLGASACGSAAAAPIARDTGADGSSHPAMAILQRLDGDHGLPDVSGVHVDEAVPRLAALGLDVQVVAFDESRTVTAQYPEPGASDLAGGQAVLWLGTPPSPPPPPPPPPPTAPAADAAPDADTTPAEVPAPAADRAPAPGGPGSGVSAGTPTPAGWSAPPRTSPRVLPALPPGTALAGLASWYGPGFEGRTTACGGVFDPGQLTFASRELRCGTRVRVTGPTGASVDAVATDWGPAEWTGRRFDLSHATFAAVHHPGAGVTTVTIEVLG